MSSKDLAMQGEQSLVVSAGPAALAFAQYGFNDMFAMAQTITKGGLFPQFKSPEQTLSLMLLCQAKGLHPMQAVERYDIVQGRPAMKAQAMQAAFQAEGGKVQFHQSDDTMCDATFSHPAGGSLRLQWDLARANAAGVTNKDTWRKHPGQMLRARCVSEGVRAVLPGVVLGIYTPEETADFEPLPPAPPRDVTPVTQHDAPRPNRIIPPHLREGNATQAKPETNDERDRTRKALKAFVDYGNRAAELGLDVHNDEGKISKARIYTLLHSQTGLHGESASAEDWGSAAKHLEDFAAQHQAALSALVEETQAAPSPVAEAKTQDDNADLEDPFKE